MGMTWRLTTGIASASMAGTCHDPIRVPEGTRPEDVICLHTIISWAKAQGLPLSLIDRLPELARRDELTTRTIADEIAELGYPWTANDLRAYWAPRPSC